jgi:hypothetical protein
MKSPDWVPHPRGRVKPLFGSALEIGDIIQRDDRCASPRGWTPTVAIGCEVVDGTSLYVRSTPTPYLRTLFSRDQVDALAGATHKACPDQARHLRAMLHMIDPSHAGLEADSP